MARQYIFHDQAGVIPDMPGTFSHCRVDIDDYGTVTTSPLVRIEASTTEPAEEPQAQPIEEQATSVKEQENAPGPNTNTNGG